MSKGVSHLISVLCCLAAATHVHSGEALSGESWWSLQPIQQVQPPIVKNTAWPLNEIDHFILARLEAEGMVPAPAADKRELGRRAAFDLTGLPPEPEELAEFIADDSPGSFSSWVEKLLASPAYGERWGRHWLDVVRYADTCGDNGDFPMPEAYRYRNYVIESFNRDKPFDEFVREQIAGDLLPAASEEDRFENVVATGYLAISRRFSSVAEEFHLTLDDTLDNLGKAFLGLSVSCARCHEHKFDPIPQADYYALYGIFESTRYAFPGTEIYRHPQDLVPVENDSEKQRKAGALIAEMREIDAKIFEIYSTMAELDTGDEKNKLKDQWNELKKKRDELAKQVPQFEMAYAVSEGEPHDTRLHVKGDHEKLGDEVPRGFLAALGGQRLPEEAEGSGRLHLANWLVDPANPLTARVIVNRVWQHHFGEGLVRTPNDFGTRGDKPAHPELLDYLTTRFVEGGWSMKALHRLIMESRVYQMASIERADYARRDPDNKLHWKFNRRRLSAEEIRDAMLFVSGALDRERGVKHPFKPAWEWRYTQHNPFVDDFKTYKRSVYLMQQRIRQQPFLGTFDGADSNMSTGERTSSATPQQALFMMNNEFSHEMAGRFATRILEEHQDDPARLRRAFQLAFNREPSAVEEKDSLHYLRQADEPLLSAGVKDSELAREKWTSLLHVLLSSNEFVFID